MAIDAASKRFSMMSFSAPISLLVPAGSINAAQRATLSNLYNGITLATAIIPPPNIDIGVDCTIRPTVGLDCTMKATIGISCLLE